MMSHYGAILSLRQEPFCPTFGAILSHLCSHFVPFNSYNIMFLKGYFRPKR